MNHSTKKILVLSNEAKDCPICRVRFKNNQAFASGCLHCYCYHCIQSWVQRQATCPLCRKPIEYLIKNVKSNNDYDIEEVVPPPNNNSDEEVNLSDLDLQENVSQSSLDSDTDFGSDGESSIDETSASVRDPDEDVFSSMSEHENVSDHEIHSETGSEPDWDDESDREVSEQESYSEDSEQESDNLSSLGNNSSISDGDKFAELEYESSRESDNETSNWSAVSSSASEADVLSSVDPSNWSDLESDDYYSSSSDY